MYDVYEILGLICLNPYPDLSLPLAQTTCYISVRFCAKIRKYMVKYNPLDNKKKLRVLVTVFVNMSPLTQHELLIIV